jgi:alpha-galactosidase
MLKLNMRFQLLLFTCIGLCVQAKPHESEVYLSDIPPLKANREMQTDRSWVGGPIAIGDISYKRGIGVRADSELIYQLGGDYHRFESWVGLDVSSHRGSVAFKVYTDGELAFDSGIVHDYGPFKPKFAFNRDRAIGVKVPLTGIEELRLVVSKTDPDGQTDFANWADAKLLLDQQNFFHRECHSVVNSVAMTPPMGLSTWNAFRFDINEKLIYQLADAMVSTGMRDAGYLYLILDEPQFKGRDENGNLIVDPERFPSGMKALGDYLHSKGLKLGMYTDALSETCGGFPGSYGHYRQDAQLFASWGVDYVKLDWNREPAGHSPKALYSEFSKALKATDRPIVFSIVHWGQGSHHWARKAGGHLWRTTFDLIDIWETQADSNYGNGILKCADQTEALGHFAGPGGWNDPDMLIVGWRADKAFSHGKKYPTDIEYRTHFSLWCMLAAPLIAGNDIRNMDHFTKETLMNAELITINQDPLGIQGWRASKFADLEVWQKPLSGGDYAVGLLNRSQGVRDITADWKYLDISGSYKARDLWKHKDIGVYDDKITLSIKPHQMIVLRLSKEKY